MKTFHIGSLRQTVGASLLSVALYTLATTPAAAISRALVFKDSTNPFGNPGQGLSSHPHHFPRPSELNDAVGFWQQVFGQWQTDQVIIHDDTHLGIVYGVVDMDGYVGWRLSAKQQALVEKQKKRLIGQLNDLDYLLHKHRGLTAEQKNLYDLITRKAGRKAIHNAAKRVRLQRGMKESFQTGLESSNRYTSRMRKVFRENGLPEALSYLPHVESAFTTTVRSSAGAVGVWQFMPVTGKRYLRIDKAIDERYDPILATHGASKYLSYAYHKLGDWGLAVTAYNFGLSGMLRARQEHGKDIGRIAKEYDSPSFGFASRNYYAEFLAVCNIMADLPKYFPKGVDYQPQPTVKHIQLTKEMTSGEIAKKYRVHYTKLAELNPAWTKAAAQGKIALPAHTHVWLPDGDLLADADEPELMPNLALSDELFAPAPSTAAGWDILKKFPFGISGQLSASVSPMYPIPDKRG